MASHRPAWSLVHFLRLVGAICDVIGVVLIAVAVMQIEQTDLTSTSIEDLETELNEERNEEGKWSLIGVIFIAIGFAAMLGAEIASWYEFSERANLHKT